MLKILFYISILKIFKIHFAKYIIHHSVKQIESKTVRQSEEEIEENMICLCQYKKRQILYRNKGKSIKTTR